jgi:MFS family permease
MTEPASRHERFATLPGSLEPLGYRNFSLYLFGFFLSNIGRWIELTGAVWLAYELTGSPLLLGFLGIARAVPAILLSPIAGVVADRVDQRRMLQIAQAAGLLLSLTMGVLVISGQAELWQLYLQVGLQSAVSSFDASVRQALFPRLVPRPLLTEAVTLHATAGRSAKFIGPVVGGLVIATSGEGAPFLLNAASFVALIVAAQLIRGVIPRAAMAGSSFRGELADGFRYIVRAPVLRGLFQLELVNALFSMTPVMITIIGREVLDVGPEGLGGLLSAPALGSLVGIVILLTLGQPLRQGRFLVLASIANAGLFVGFALAAEYVLAFAALIAIGLTDSLIGVTRQNMAQLAAPGRMRGRVMANMGTVTRGVSPLAEAQAGVLSSLLSGPAAVLIAAGALALTAAWTGRSNPALWRFIRDDRGATLPGGGAPPPTAPGEPPALASRP